jgi:TRAP transporter 4TM/12TM fusion protein
MSRLPPELARRIDRLARRAHAFHRFAHHPLCSRYRAEVVRIGRRTRLCRGCALTAAGALAGAGAGLAAEPPGPGVLAALTALLLAGVAWAASARSGAPRPKLLSRLVPMALAAALLGLGLRAGALPGLLAALAGGASVAAAALAYRRRGPDRAACRGCPEAPASLSCSGFRPIARRERAFARLAGRWMAREAPSAASCRTRNHGRVDPAGFVLESRPVPEPLPANPEQPAGPSARTPLLGVLLVIFVGWSLYGAVVPVETYLFRMVHMGMIYALAFLAYPLSPRAPRWTRAADAALALLGVAAIAWALLDLDSFVRRSTVPEPADLWLGIAMILLLVEISRRVVGPAFTLVLVGFLLYLYFGNHIPGPLSHKGYDLDRIVGHLYMTLEGVFGVPLAVSVSFVTLFVVYGALMDAAGAGTFWLELSLAVMGRGPASAGRGAVLTTALLGGPQGSGVATTMSVAPVMWPILRQAGYSPDMAAGLISAGGIGAVLSPPLMGAAAFLIMQFLGVSFWEVVVMVTVPTLLYYLGTFLVVELEARKLRFRAPEMPHQGVWKVLRTRGHHLVSLGLLVALLALGRSPEDSAIWAILATVGTSFLSRDRGEWLTPRRLWAATVEGARGMLPVAALLAAAGMIVGTFSLTGLGLKISTLIMSLSGGSVLGALLLAMVASFVIGLSLPITATYIMTVVMVAPALVKVGMPSHVAHLLAFYFAVLSEVSPPVGLSPSAAAAVTGGNAFRSMMQAWKYSLPAFLVPFLFSASPVGSNLLLVGVDLPEFLHALAGAAAALFFLSAGTVGWLGRPLSPAERVLLVAAALPMVALPIGPSLGGLVPLAVGGAVAARALFAGRAASRLATP